MTYDPISYFQNLRNQLESLMMMKVMTHTGIQMMMTIVTQALTLKMEQLIIDPTF